MSGFVRQLDIQTSVLSSPVSFDRSGQHTSLAGTRTSTLFVEYSYGSFLSNSLVATEPTAVDGVVMTGYGL